MKKLFLIFGLCSFLIFKTQHLQGSEPTIDTKKKQQEFMKAFQQLLNMKNESTLRSSQQITVRGIENQVRIGHITITGKVGLRHYPEIDTEMIQDLIKKGATPSLVSPINLATMIQIARAQVPGAIRCKPCLQDGKLHITYNTDSTRYPTLIPNANGSRISPSIMQDIANILKSSQKGIIESSITQNPRNPDKWIKALTVQLEDRNKFSFFIESDDQSTPMNHGPILDKDLKNAVDSAGIQEQRKEDVFNILQVKRSGIIGCQRSTSSDNLYTFCEPLD